MKKSSLLLSLFLTCISFSQVSYNFNIGTNFSKMKMKDDYFELSSSALTGLNIGFFGEINLSNALYFQTGLQYARKGTNFKLWSVRQKLNYLDFPLNLVFKYNITDDVKLCINAGPYLGLAVSGKSQGVFLDYGEEPIDIGTNPKTDWLKPLEFGLSIGAGAEYKSFALRFQYSNSLNNLSADNSEDFVMKNKVFSINASYRLNNNN
jgi:hypothetical protein